MAYKKRKRKLLFRRKRTLDPTIVIDYKEPDQLKRFITDRCKVIPRRISGATASQQRLITKSIKQARYLALLPYTVMHRQEKKLIVDAALAAAAASARRPPSRHGEAPRDRGEREGAPGPQANTPNQEGEN